MSEQDTPKDPVNKEPEQKGDEYEKRYKDLQAEFTKRTQHEKELEASLQDLRANYDTLAAHVQQNIQPKEDESAYEYASKKDIAQMQQQMQRNIEAANLASEFRAKYPDMVAYEDQIAYYLEAKTDKRKNLKDRMESAVAATKDFLEVERNKGIQSAEEERNRKAAEEAQASGLSYETTPPVSDSVVAETPNEYLEFRRKKRNLNAGIA